MDQRERQLKHTGEYTPSAGLKRTLHGDVYQLKLLMLFLLRALKFTKNFSLATEMDGVGSFDDVVFSYENGNGEREWRFLQAKHVRDVNGRLITEDDLKTEKDGDFSLQKYFNSFRKIIRNCYKVRDLTIFTNIDLDEKLINSNATGLKFNETTDDDKILFNIGRKYKIDLVQGDDSVATILKASSDFKRLTNILAYHILKGEKITLKDDLFKSYHFILAKQIIDIRRKKFQETFIDSVDEKIVTFRNEFFKEVLLQVPNVQLTNFEVAADPDLDSMSNEDLDEVVDDLKEKMENAEGKVIRITSHQYYDGREKVIAENPRVLQFIFTRKDRKYDIVKGTSYTQSFSSLFVTGNKKLCEKYRFIDYIREKLKTELNKDNDEFETYLETFTGSIIGEKFKFEGGKINFPLYTEEAVQNFIGPKSKNLIKIKTCEDVENLAQALHNTLFEQKESEADDNIMTIKQYYNDLVKKEVISCKHTYVQEFSREETFPSVEIKINSKAFDSSDKTVSSLIKSLEKKFFDYFQNDKQKQIFTSSKFGNTTPKISEEFKKAFLDKFPDNTDEVTVIELDTCSSTIFERNIKSLAGHVLTLQEGIITFSSDFRSDTKLLHDVGRLRNELEDVDSLRKELKNKNIKLANCQFKIEGFTCQSALPENDDVTEGEMNEFFKKLRFEVCKYDEVKLGEKIAKEIGKQFGLLDSDFVYSDFQRWVLDWFKQKKGVFRTSHDVIKFFEEVHVKIATLKLTGTTLLYRKKIEQYGITFDESKTSERLKTFVDPASKPKTQIYIRIVAAAADTTSGAIEVYETLKYFEKYKKQGSHIFLNLKNLLLLRELVLKALQSKQNDLLVIECKTSIQSKVCELYPILDQIIAIKPPKKIVLITADGCILTENQGRTTRAVSCTQP